MNYPSVSILITTFNGKKLLQTLLPLVQKATKFYQGQSEILLIDDGGTDGSDEFVIQNFPEVKYIKLEKNVGPLNACNRGFQECKNQIIILLDNDVVVLENFIDYLVPHFNQSDVFAVRPAYRIDPRNGIDSASTSKPRLAGRFKFGLIYPTEIDAGTGNSNFAFIAGGGGCALDRKKLLELGSFDKMFSPFYYEDADISYRAWKRGWRIIFEPSSIVFHEGTGTITRFHSVNYVSMICERNRYLLIWKNITDPWFIIKHLIFIPIRLLVNLIKCNFASIAGFFCALPHIREVVKKRKLEKKFIKVNDKEIFNIFK